MCWNRPFLHFLITGRDLYIPRPWWPCLFSQRPLAWDSVVFTGSAWAGIFTSWAEMNLPVSHTNPCKERWYELSPHVASCSLPESVLPQRATLEASMSSSESGDRCHVCPSSTSRAVTETGEQVYELPSPCELSSSQDLEGSGLRQQQLWKRSYSSLPVICTVGRL